MPDPLLTQAIKEAYASAPDDVVVHETIELRHVSFLQPIRVVLGHEDLVARLEATAPLNPNEYVNFIGYAFRFKLPEVQSGGLPELEIEIDNVTHEIEQALEQAAQSADKVEMTYRPYLSTDLTAPHMNPPMTVQLKEIRANDFQVHAKAGFRDLVNRNFPAEEYTWTRFPGLAR